jgi:F0F1-type ATP synthase alpha subunit
MYDDSGCTLPRCSTTCPIGIGVKLYGYFDDVAVDRIRDCQAAMEDFFKTRKDALLTEIRTKAALDKDLEAKLQAACDEWKPTFAV